MGQRNWQKWRDILICVICIGVILWFLWGLLLGIFVHAVVLLLLGMAVAFLLTPAVHWLEGRGVPRALATLVVLLLALAAVGGLGYALVSTLIHQVQRFSTTVIIYFNALPDQLSSFQKFLVNSGIPQSNIDDAIKSIQSQAYTFAQTTVNNVVNLVVAIAGTLVDVLIILVLGFYFTVDGAGIRVKIIGIFPKNWATHITQFEDALNRVVGNYIRGQLTLALMIGVLAGGGCLIPLLGLSDFAVIVGILAFVFETIPMVGPALASIPAIILSLLLPHPFSHIFWVIGYFILIQMVESNILGPRIVGHAVGLHPIASLLALIIGAQLFGAFGALLATPIVAAGWVVIESIYHSARGETADQIMSKKRTAWVISRPTGALLRGKKDRSNATGPLSLTNRARPIFKSKKRPTVTVEHMDLMYPPPSPSRPYQPSSASGSHSGKNGGQPAEPAGQDATTQSVNLLRGIARSTEQSTTTPYAPEDNQP